MTFQGCWWCLVACWCGPGGWSVWVVSPSRSSFGCEPTAGGSRRPWLSRPTIRPRPADAAVVIPPVPSARAGLALRSPLGLFGGRDGQLVGHGGHGEPGGPVGRHVAAGNDDQVADRPLASD